jgi:hypothetical protein
MRTLPPKGHDGQWLEKRDVPTARIEGYGHGLIRSPATTETELIGASVQHDCII